MDTESVYYMSYPKPKPEMNDALLVPSRRPTEPGSWLVPA